jgi:hypothetical protein
MGTRRIAAIILLAAFAGGIALDKLWLAAQVPYFSNAVILRPGITAFGRQVLGGFSFGLPTPLILMLLALVLLLFPWTHARYPVARQERFRLIGRITIRILLLPLWVLALGFIYMMAKPYLPAAVAVALESFGFKPSLYYGVPDAAHQLLEQVDGSVACMIGLAIGLLLVYYKFPR